MTTIRIAATALILALLAGCGTRPAKVVTQRVEVPVPVSCVDRGDIPPERHMETDSLQKSDTIFDKVQAAAIDLKGLQADDKVMRALLEACTTN